MLEAPVFKNPCDSTFKNNASKQQGPSKQSFLVSFVMSNESSVMKMKAYMCLSCKAGVYNTVLEDLLKLNIPRGDIFLLLGPMDVLVQFTAPKSLEEFVEKWFNPIRMIGAEDALLKRSMTLIVIHEGPEYAEEPFAFVFLNTQPRNLEKLQEALLSVPEVISADTVFGPYDLICAVRANDRLHLEKAIGHIHKNVPGIEGAMTSVVASLRV
jgi:hypothetical protein